MNVLRQMLRCVRAYYRQRLARRPSTSRRSAESFFAALKNERVNRTQYPTRKHAMKDVARYIELRYNSRRLHSGLGYKTPNEVHNEYLNGQRAA